MSAFGGKADVTRTWGVLVGLCVYLIEEPHLDQIGWSHAGDIGTYFRNVVDGDLDMRQRRTRLKDRPVVFVDAVDDVLLKIKMIVQKRLGDVGIGLEYMYCVDVGADDLFCQFGLTCNLPPRRDDASTGHPDLAPNIGNYAHAV